MKSPLLRAALLLLGAAVFVAALVGLALPLVIAQPPPADVTTRPPAGEPLTRHLALVIVDGLRHEFAVDEALMPALSRRMRDEASGVILAGPVSMTSSAILTYATGQRGDIEQIVNNESGARVGYDHLMKGARAAGLTTAYTGDRAWIKMFPDAWDLAHPDPKGVGIEVDYNAEIFAASYGFLAHEPRPSFYVLHFVTPDHQGHAYGVLDERYTRHIHAFDGLLEGLLAAIPEDTTVFVTSDHGMTDTGTHGSDTPIQRRSPILAYGPGIARGRKEARELDQIDLPATFAVLLGTASPAQSRGLLLADWLDVSEEERARLACAELDRLSDFARASGVGPDLLAEGERACATGAPAERTAGATRVATSIDRAIGEAATSGSRLGLVVPAFAVAGALALSAAALGREARERHGRRLAMAALAAVLLLAVAVALTYSLELLPGLWPTPARVALYIVVNAALLAGIVRPRAAMTLVERHAPVAAVIFPGLLVASQTRATQPEAYALAAVLSLFAMTVGLPRAGAFHGGPWLSPRWRLALVIALIAALGPVGTQEGGYLPKALTSDTTWMPIASCVAIALFAVERRARDRASGALLPVVGALLAMGSLWGRRYAPAEVCLAAWLGLGVAAIGAHRAGRRSLTELLALASYAWVSRDAEIPILLATYVVAAAVGDAIGADLRRDGDAAAPRVSTVLCVVGFLFAWTFVQRIGVELGLDFVHFDWGAGAFREADVSLLRIGAALSYKHGLARAAVLFAVMVALPARHRRLVAQGLFVAELCRAATLVTMLYFCRHSFWTSLRIIGDLPHALAAVIVTAAAIVAVEAGLARRGATGEGRPVTA